MTITIAASVYLLLSFIVCFLAFYLVFKLLRGIFRITSVEGKYVLLALGLASIPFPTVLPAFFKSYVWFAIDLAAKIPPTLHDNWYQATKVCGGDSVVKADCIMTVGLGVWSAFASGLRTVYYNSNVYTLRYDLFLLFLALWITICLSFREKQPSTSEAGGGGPSGTWLGTVYSRLSKVDKRNILFFLTLSVGAYLSIAAIVAIPALLEKSEPVEIEKIGTDLKTRMDEVLKAEQDAIDSESSKDPRTGDPFQVLKSALDDLKKHALQGAANEGASVNTAAESNPREPDTAWADWDLKLEESKRQDLFSQWKTLLTIAKSRASADELAATSAFDRSNSGRLGIRETNAHAIELETWFHNRTNALSDQMNRCKTALQHADDLWSNWAEAEKQSLRTPPANRYKVPSPSSSVSECLYTEEEYSIPSRPSAGEFLGPFGLVARWLVETESIHLALITGLLGFGLLGSACSTFIREHLQRREGEPLVKDLSGVLIRGSSAAVVVFLAVEGGLGIFAGASANPNPYVLLFTCLVASVFSHEVWNWAHKQLWKGLGESQHEDDASSQQAQTGVVTTAESPPKTGESIKPSKS